jgi:hypothetical protein
MYKLIILLIMVLSCSKPILRHECRFDMCPYKGIRSVEFSHAVKVYTGSNVFDDSYKIDMLHLEYPSLEYDSLILKLF